MGQPEADALCAAFQGITREPPLCIQGAHEQIWNGVVESIKEILGLILVQTQEGSTRALLQWNSRAHIPSGRGDGVLKQGTRDDEVLLETNGFAIERPYSCAACWDCCDYRFNPVRAPAWAVLPTH
jgi:hypothetical protein